MGNAMDEIMGILPKVQTKNKSKKEEDSKDEMIGHSSNRQLHEKWNIKIQLDAGFFVDTFKFLTELGYNTLFRFNKKGIKIFKLDTSTTHFSYVVMDKLEFSNYIIDWKNTPLYKKENTTENQEENTTKHQEENTTKHQEENTTKHQEENQKTTNTEINEDEIIVYIEIDAIENMVINDKYPVDIYFDTLEKNTYYIVNGKQIISRRLNSLENNNNTINMFSKYYDKMLMWKQDENTSKITVTSKGIENVLKSLDKKKSKKEDKTKTYVEVKFDKNEIDFIVSDEIMSSSHQLYGDDIVVKGKLSTKMVFDLSNFIKFSKLKLSDNVHFYINEMFPLVIETKYGTNKTSVYFAIAARSDAN